MKKLFKVIAVLILVLLIAPVFFPSKISMSRSIEIQASDASVFSKLADLNEYNKWNPFPEGDPSNQVNVSGIGMGSSLIWKGQKTGEGKMTIIGMEPNKKIDIKMEFFEPMRAEGLVHWITFAKSDIITEMTWTFEQDLTYFNRYFGIMMDAMMGKHFERGLASFKKMVESK